MFTYSLLGLDVKLHENCNPQCPLAECSKILHNLSYIISKVMDGRLDDDGHRVEVLSNYDAKS
jgi:hypothetical protein